MVAVRDKTSTILFAIFFGLFLVHLLLRLPLWLVPGSRKMYIAETGTEVFVLDCSSPS
jgi:hypothetical protein